MYGPCILLSRLKFRFAGKENSVTELPKHLRNRQSLVKLSYAIRSIPYLTHNILKQEVGDDLSVSVLNLLL